MIQHSWTGNIRELKNVVRRTAVRANTDIIDQIDFGKLDEIDKTEKVQAKSERDIKPLPEEAEISPLEEIEKKAIEKAYFRSDRNAAEAAKVLGISRATMYRKLKQFGYET